MVKIRNIKIAIIFAISTLLAVCFSLLMVPVVTQTQQQDSTPASAVVNKYGFQEDIEGYYLINSVDDFNNMTNYFNIVEGKPEVKFKLMNDLSLGDSFIPVASSAQLETTADSLADFAYGTFDGNFHTIEWFASYDLDSSLLKGKCELGFGLFSAACLDFKIENLKLVGDLNIVGHDPQVVGGLIGYLYTSNDRVANITTCYVDLDITLEDTNEYDGANPKSNYLGGFVGRAKYIKNPFGGKPQYFLIDNSVFLGDLEIKGNLKEGAKDFWGDPKVYNCDSFCADIISYYDERYNCYATKYHTVVYDYKNLSKDYTVVSCETYLNDTINKFTVSTNLTEAIENKVPYHIWYINPVHKDYYGSYDYEHIIQIEFLKYYKVNFIPGNGCVESFNRLNVGYILAEDKDKIDIVCAAGQTSYNSDNLDRTLYVTSYDQVSISITSKSIIAHRGYNNNEAIIDLDEIRCVNDEISGNYLGDILIPISFEIIKYPIKIYRNHFPGDTELVSVENATYKISDLPLKLEDVCDSSKLQREGYSCIGFGHNRNSTYEQRVEEIPTGTIPRDEKGLTYYCIWKKGSVEVKRYNFIVYANLKGSDTSYREIFSTADPSFKIIDKIPFDNNPVEGYELKGFATNAGSEVATIPLNEVINPYQWTKDIILYCIWQEKTYNLIVETYPEDVKETVTIEGIKASEFKDGYSLAENLPFEEERIQGLNFLGYVKDPRDNVPIETISLEDFGTSETLKIYARYEKIEYTAIAFRNKDESGDRVEVKFDIDTLKETSNVVDLFKTKPEDYEKVVAEDRDKEYYTFLGFNENKVATEGLLDIQLTITKETPLIQKFYAIWGEDECTLTIKDAVTNKEIYKTTFTISLLPNLSEIDCSKEGYTFTGFTFNGEEITEITTENVEENMVIYANHEIINYTIKVYGNFESADPEFIEIPYNVTMTDGINLKDAAAYTRDGYTLTGYSNTNNGKASEIVITYATIMEFGVSYYCIWAESTDLYQITVMANYANGTNEEDFIYYKNISNYSLTDNFTFDDEGNNSAGLEFICYSKSNTEISSITSITAEDFDEHKSLVVYAIWDKTEYKSILYRNSDKSGEKIELTYTIDNNSQNILELFKSHENYSNVVADKEGYSYTGKISTIITDKVGSDNIPINITKETPLTQDYFVIWEEESYTLTIKDSVTDKNLVENAKFLYSELPNLTEKYNFQKDGYRFINFTLNGEEVTQMLVSHFNSDGDAIVYANYELIDYEIKVWRNFDSIDSNFETLSYNVEMGNFNLRNHVTYTKDGYKIAGFGTNKFGTSVSEVELSGNVPTRLEYWCIWSCYTLTIYRNLYHGDTTSTSVPFTEEDEFYLKDKVTFSLSETGYIFKCFNTNKNSTDGAIDVKLKKGTTQDLTYYCVWEPIEYTIRVYLNNPNGIDYTAFEEKIVTTNELKLTYSLLNNFSYDNTNFEDKPEGYNFKFYAREKTATKAENVINYIPAEGVTLVEYYAIWGITGYTLTIKPNYVGATGEKISFNVEDLDFKVADKSEFDDTPRTDFRFKGFNTNATGTGTFVDTITELKNQTLYCIWEEIIYIENSIMVWANDLNAGTAGEEYETYTYTAEQGVGITLANHFNFDNVKKEGHIFQGYATDREGTNMVSETISGTTVYYAIWQLETRTLTFKGIDTERHNGVVSMYINDVEQIEVSQYLLVKTFEVYYYTLVVVKNIEKERQVTFSFVNSNNEKIVLMYKYPANAYSIKTYFETSNITKDTEIKPELEVRYFNFTLLPSNYDAVIKVDNMVVDAPYTIRTTNAAIKELILEHDAERRVNIVKMEMRVYHVVNLYPDHIVTIRYEVPDIYAYKSYRIVEIYDNPTYTGSASGFIWTGTGTSSPFGENYNLLGVSGTTSIEINFKPANVNITFAQDDYADLYIDEELQNDNFTLATPIDAIIETISDIPNNVYSYLIYDKDGTLLHTVKYVVKEKKYWVKQYNLPGEGWYTSRFEPVWQVSNAYGLNITIHPIITLKSYNVDVA